MKTRLNIKNFRIFDEDGAIFEINPITILTGCNSSGKSSAVKAIMLLNSFLSQIKKDIENGKEVDDFSKYKLDFTQYPMNLLGRFDKVVNNRSESRKITIEYTVYSLIISKDVNVKLVFSANENDDLNNGYLENITISIDEDIFYSSDKEENYSVCNMNMIKESCIDFIEIEFLIHHLYGLVSSYDIDGNITEAECKQKSGEIISYLKGLDRQRVKDIIKYVRVAKVKSPIVKKNVEVVEWSRNNKSLFKIPLLETLDELEKEEIKQFINKEFLCNVGEARSFLSNKIIDEFVNSEFNLFSEYFNHYENIFLDEVRSYNGFYKTPRIFEAYDYKISQDHINHNPENRPVFTFGLDENEDYVSICEDTKDNSDKLNREWEEWKNQPITFCEIYGMLMEWNDMSEHSDDGIYYSKTEGYDIHEKYCHRMFTILKHCIETFIKDTLCPDWCTNIEYVGSSRTKISRLYSLDAKDDFTDLLKRYFEAKTISFNNTIYNKEYITDNFINKWIKIFGIGDRLSVKYDEEGLGATIRLYKNSKDTIGKLLSDEGYGITQLVSILLQIESAILSAKGESVNGYYGAYYMRIDGYDYDKFHYEMKTICIEEPEIHLHPRYQSLLADMFVEAYQKYNIHFIIETHSEYLIRRLQVLVGNKDKDSELNIKNDDISIFYINSQLDVKNTGEPLVKHIKICEDGYLDDTFGTGFFDEASKLSKKLMF